jgi:uncharacterized protein YqfA (UPF0365 family)
MRAKVVEAEAQVPLAIAEAFKAGHLAAGSRPAAARSSASGNERPTS